MVERIKKLYASGMAPSLLYQMIASGLSFVVGIAAARILGISDFGIFALIFLLSQFLATAEAHLLSTPMMTLAGAKKKLSATYYGSVLVVASLLSATSGAVLAGGMAVYFALKGAEPDISLAAIAFFVFSQNLAYMTGRILFAQKRFSRALIFECIRPAVLILFALFWTAHAIKPDLDAILLMLAATGIIPVIVAVSLWVPIKISFRMIRAITSRHWPISRWFLLIWFVSIFQEQGVWVMLGLQVGDEAVGALRAVQTLLGITQVLVLSLENFLPRSAAEAFRGGNISKLRDYLINQTLIIAGMSLVIILPVDFFASEIMALVFGKEFGQYGHLFLMFSAVYFIVLARGMAVHYLRAIEQPQIIFRAFLMSSITAVVLIYPMLAYFGLEGAVYCMIVAQTVCLAGVLVPALRHSRQPAVIEEEDRMAATAKLAG